MAKFPWVSEVPPSSTFVDRQIRDADDKLLIDVGTTNAPHSPFVSVPIATFVATVANLAPQVKERRIKDVYQRRGYTEGNADFVENNCDVAAAFLEAAIKLKQDLEAAAKRDAQ